VAAEIERVFLLRAVPEPMPAGETWHIEQGYLPVTGEDGPGHAGMLEGRLRRIERPDGSVRHVHTLKRGTGLVREELEREIDAATFAGAWPRTEGRRLSKVRTRVREGHLTWEVDRFMGLPVILAECELPAADAPLPIPAWLAPWVEREVTDDPAYRNYELARRAGLVKGR
jgi:adenylate cyclase